MLSLLIPAAGAAYMWKATSAAQQFDQKIDKVNPVVTTQNVALGSVDTRLINADLRMRHGQTQPEFFAKPVHVETKKGKKTFARPYGDVPMSSNYNRAFVTERKMKRMTPRGARKMTSTSDAVVQTDRMAARLYKIDTSRWPY